jgi:hypothetical protein
LCRLLGTQKFADFCKKRDVSVSADRLLEFEKMGIFNPLFRLRIPDEDRPPLCIPLTDPEWFNRGWAIDTTLSKPHWTPHDGEESEAYYSEFQIASLQFVLNRFTASMQLESFVSDNKFDEVAWASSGKQLFEFIMPAAEAHEADALTDGFRPAIDLLCQFISDRYYPLTQGNGRTMRVSGGGYSYDDWIVTNGLKWEWWDYARAWKPTLASEIFGLSPKKLRHAFEALASQQAWDDPLEKWYQLIQFVSPRQRARLKGAALASETMRSGALMLRLLHKDLYGIELPDPNETTRTIITHMPELEVRTDARRHLEFVVNQFDLNPRPKLTLFVEGRSEEVAVKSIFERYFGASHGTHSIEIIVLGGVNNATGRKEDRFSAILRLVDYLHYHQTFTFLILDNENNAARLKLAAANQPSILHDKRLATRAEYVKVWKRSFEFDNFSATEIADALNQISTKVSLFVARDILKCLRERNSGNALTELYRARVGRGLNKLELSQRLVEGMFSERCRREPRNRPIIAVLKRVVKLAARNPFPVRDDDWHRNQASSHLGRRRKR